MGIALSGRIVIIGFGNMGKALARGLQCGQVGDVDLYVCDRHEWNENEETPAGLDMKRLRFLSQRESSKLRGGLLLTPADTVLLCMKPQNFVDAAEAWKPVFLDPASSEGPLVISILAGVPTEAIHRHFAGPCPVVRAMPNIAATVDASATALCGSATTSSPWLERACAVFDSVGRSWVVPEDMLNAVTGLSGSGPAYIYMVIEALSDGGVKMGMPRQLALDLAAQTVLGAARLVQETKQHPAVLRDQVTTPGGTTISAIHELEKRGLRHMLISAVVTATRKSALLAKRAKGANRKESP